MPKILAVDDKRLAHKGKLWIERHLERALRNTEYDFEVVEDGEEALQKVRERTFDLLLLDLRLPCLGGWDLVEYLESEGIRLPILIVSAFGTRQNLLAAVNTPEVVGFIEKPLQYAQLMQALHRQVEPVFEQGNGEFARTLDAPTLIRLAQQLQAEHRKRMVIGTLETLPLDCLPEVRSAIERLESGEAPSGVGSPPKESFQDKGESPRSKHVTLEVRRETRQLSSGPREYRYLSFRWYDRAGHWRGRRVRAEDTQDPDTYDYIKQQLRTKNKQDRQIGEEYLQKLRQQAVSRKLARR